AVYWFVLHRDSSVNFAIRILIKTTVQNIGIHIGSVLSSRNATIRPGSGVYGCIFVRRVNGIGCRVIVHRTVRSEEHTSELQSREKLVCRLLLEKKNSSKPSILQLIIVKPITGDD